MTEAAWIPTANGGRLAGRFERPERAVRAVALFAHCFTCGKDQIGAVKVSRALAARGIATLRFDVTGVGASAGGFNETTFSANVDDIVAAADWLRQTEQAPALLVGHSLGGAAVIAAAHRIPEVRAVATIGAPADIAHVLHRFGDALPTIEQDGQAAVTVGGRVFQVGRNFVDDAREQSVTSHLAKLKKPILFLHAPLDDEVDLDNATKLFAAARHPKSFISLDDANHLLTGPGDAEAAGAAIAGWVERYLPTAAVSESPQPPPGVVRVQETGGGAFENMVAVGTHRFPADEPATVGGGDAGPTPYDLLGAALGACVSMTVRMYAARKAWPLERISVDVSHAKIHAADCADCETREGKVDELRVSLTFEGSLDEEQRARLIEIAAKCPVHRTLHSEIKTRIEWAST
jgi:putative redox protein